MEILRTLARSTAYAPVRRAAARHCARALLATLALALSTAVPAASAVVGLHDGTVAGELTDAARPAAVEAALRQVVVRVTGRRGAGTDPALAPLYAAAERYVQTVRPAAGGLVTVGFDADALDAALARAGQPLWGRVRPATLVVLVVARPGLPAVLTGGEATEETRAIDRAAQLRGVPLVWPGALEATAAVQLADAVATARGDLLLEVAARYDASGVLAGRATGAGVQWSWFLPAGQGSVAGTPEDGVHAVADRHAAALASGAGATLALLPVVVTGTRGPADLAAVAAALGDVPDVRGVRLERASGGDVTFRVNFRGDPATLHRAIAAGGRLRPAEDEPGSLRFAFTP
jgi:hypothetical protein